MLSWMTSAWKTITLIPRCVLHALLLNYIVYKNHCSQLTESSLITLKGPIKNCSYVTNMRFNFDCIFTERTVKGPNFEYLLKAEKLEKLLDFFSQIHSQIAPKQ
jgi:hypothetical protein